MLCLGLLVFSAIIFHFSKKKIEEEEKRIGFPISWETQLAPVFETIFFGFCYFFLGCGYLSPQKTQKKKYKKKKKKQQKKKKKKRIARINEEKKYYCRVGRWRRTLQFMFLFYFILSHKKKKAKSHFFFVHFHPPKKSADAMHLSFLSSSNCVFVFFNCGFIENV